MKNTKVYFMLLGFALFTGMTFNLAKYTVGYLNPTSVAAWRFGVAAAVMVVILFLREGVRGSQLKQNGLWYMILGTIGVFGFNSCFFLGMKFTSPVNGSLIMAMNPLLTTVLARIILKDKISQKAVIGVCFGLVGVLLVITQGSLSVLTHLSFSIGDVIILVGNICWALYGVLGRRFIQNGTPLSTTTYTMVVGALGLIGYALLSSASLVIPNVPTGVWGSILFMALCTSVLGYLWWNQGMTAIGAGKTSLFFNLVPVVTMLTSVVSGHPVTIVQVLGGLLVIIGVLVSSGLIGNKTQTLVQSS